MRLNTDNTFATLLLGTGFAWAAGGMSPLKNHHQTARAALEGLASGELDCEAGWLTVVMVSAVPALCPTSGAEAVDKS